jgi:hypothetical protein
MITEAEIKNIISDSVKQMDAIDTTEFTEGKFNRYLSKAFVAGIGRYFAVKYDSKDFETKYQDFKNGKGISGEWLFDATVVKVKSVEAKKKKHIKYPFKVEVAIESELDPGSKAFTDDFSKLLVVNAVNKIYINGVKNKSDKNKYVNERIEFIKSILNTQSDIANYFICFVDHPRYWKDNDVFVKIIAI